MALPGLGLAATLPSAIGAVTVYQDRAVVTRSGSIELDAGEHELVVERLPAMLQDTSLQVSAKSTGQATLLDVKTALAIQADSSNERVKALDDEIRKLVARQGELDDQAAVLENQREWVALMQRGAVEPTREGGRPTLEQLNAIQTQSADTLSKALAGLRRISAEKEELDRQLEVLHARQQQLRADAGKRSKNVTLRVKMARAGKVDLSLSYAVAGARWTPAYDARLRSADRAVELGYFGVIRQNTGEDWNKVKLTLSTARPSLGGGAPTLTPWVIDVAQPVVVPPPMPAPAAAAPRNRRAPMAEMTVAGDMKPEPVAEAIDVATSAVQNESTSASFQIEALATLPSDNSMQRVAITTARLPATLQYQAAPGLRETAYLTAQASNDTAFPFLAGNLNSFLGDAFIASSTIKTVMPGEKLDLAMGADESISIKRALVNRLSETTGLTGSGRRVTYEYKITVKNNKSSKEQIAFSENLPVSRNEKIVVKLLSPGEKEITRGDEGKLTWNWELEPGKSRETTLKFSIDYPGDIEVSGI